MAFQNEELSKLTKQQKDDVYAWLKMHWIKGQECPISGHTSWLVADHLVAPPLASPPSALQGVPIGAAALGSPTGFMMTQYPQVMVVCRGCGYTIYFNAIAIGIVGSGGQRNVNP